MNLLKKAKTIKFWFSLLIILAALMSINLTSSSKAQTYYPDPIDIQGPGGCAEDTCGKLNCSSNAVAIANLLTYDVVEPCRYVGDTGTYYFMAEFSSTADTKYDVTTWIAADGKDAKKGTCYMDFLNPVTTIEPDLNLLGGYGPFRNEEPTAVGDTCGDIKQGEIANKIVGPIEIACTETMLDNKQVYYVIGWGNSSNTADCFTGKCPGTPALCNAAAALVEVNTNIVDLALDKVAATQPAGWGDIIDYTITVTNNSGYTSTGYKITDTLLPGLEYVSSSLTYPNSCDTEGSEVTCYILDDLDPGASASFTLSVLVTDAYPDLGPITNTACVKGNEYEHDGTDPLHESTLSDNCDNAEVMYKVVDLAMEKNSNTSSAGWGDPITFSFSVSNEGSFSSSGYTITDTLYDGLQFQSSNPPDMCSANGQVVTCNITDSLAAGATADPITIQVLVTQSYEGPSPITNEACVWANEYEYDGNKPLGSPVDSTLYDNCDTANVPTNVELLSFTGLGGLTANTLTWETAEEIDLLGFNLYRATSLKGSRLKLNDSLIMGTYPGAPFGETYTYVDAFELKPEATYYYWLEDLDVFGQTTLHGPVILNASEPAVLIPLPYRIMLPLIVGRR